VTLFPTREINFLLHHVTLRLILASINPYHPLPSDKAAFDGCVVKIKGYLLFNPDETVLGLANAALVRLLAGRVVVASGTAWIYRANGVWELKAGDAIPELAPKP